MNPTGFSFLWLIFPPFLYSQDELAAKAVAALSSLYGTKFEYGSIITTICECWGSPKTPKSQNHPHTGRTPHRIPIKSHQCSKCPHFSSLE